MKRFALLAALGLLLLTRPSPACPVVAAYAAPAYTYAYAPALTYAYAAPVYAPAYAAPAPCVHQVSAVAAPAPALTYADPGYAVPAYAAAPVYTPVYGYSAYGATFRSNFFGYGRNFGLGYGAGLARARFFGGVAVAAPFVPAVNVNVVRRGIFGRRTEVAVAAVGPKGAAVVRIRVR